MVGGPGQVLQDLRPVVEQLPLHRPLLVGRQILGDVHISSRAGDGRLGTLDVAAADVRVLRGVGGHRGGACESGAPALQIDGGGAVPAKVVEGAEHVGAAELHLAVDGDGRRAAPGAVNHAAIGQGGAGDDSASHLDGHVGVGVAVALHLVAVHRRGHKGAVGDGVLLDVSAQHDLLAGGDAVGGPCGSLVDGDEGRLALLHLRFDGGDLRLLGPDLSPLVGDLGGVGGQVAINAGGLRLHHHGLLLLQDLQLALQLGQGGLLRLQLHMEQSVFHGAGEVFVLVSGEAGLPSLPLGDQGGGEVVLRHEVVQVVDLVDAHGVDVADSHALRAVHVQAGEDVFRVLLDLDFLGQVVQGDVHRADGGGGGDVPHIDLPLVGIKVKNAGVGLLERTLHEVVEVLVGDLEGAIFPDEPLVHAADGPVRHTLQDDAQDGVIRRGGVPEVVGPVFQGELLEGEFILQGVRLHCLDLPGGALGNSWVDQNEPPNTKGVHHAHPHNLLVARDPLPIHVGGVGEGEGGRLVVAEGAGHAEGVAQRLDGRPIQVS